MNKKVVIVSGGFDPVHVGHVRMFREARKLGDLLVVLLNNDDWLRRKKGYVFMNEDERGEIIRSIKYVDAVILTSHNADREDMSVSEELEHLATEFNKVQLIFANGGDRGEGNVPEDEVCAKMNIQMVYNVGGEKIQSSSKLVEKVKS